MEQPPFTQEYLKSILRYDPETGKMFWREREAGTVQGNGYHHIMIGEVHYYRASLARFYVTGIWPERMDHKDRVRTNDAYENIRPCTRAQNRHNAKVNENSLTGVKGVTYRKSAMKWQARIQVDGRQMSLGCFDTKEEAAAAYEIGARKFYGEFASTGDGQGAGAPALPKRWNAKKETTLEDIFGRR